MEKKVFIFENALYQGAPERDFYWYCVRRQLSLIRFAVIYMVCRIIRGIGFISRERYLAVRWSFLDKVKNKEMRMLRFAKKKKKHFSRKLLADAGEDSCWVSKHPEEFVRAFTAEAEIRSDYLVLAEQGAILLYDRWFQRGENIDSRAVYRGKAYRDPLGYLLKRFTWAVFLCAAVLILSSILCVCELYFNKSSYGMELFRDYFTRPKVVALNFLPVLWIWLFITFLSGRVWLGFLVSGTVTGLVSLVNYFKLEFRNDPLLFEDLNLLFESVNMSGKYDVQLSKSMILFVIGIAAAAILLAFLFGKTMRSWTVRGAGTVLCLLVLFTQFKKLYYSPEIYVNLKETSGITNQWSQTDSYVSRGGLYPFLHSIQSATLQEPEGYQKREAENLYESYEYSDIPDAKKVNVISVMLEAYNDFSKFEEVTFEKDPYEYLHELEAESYSGELVTNIFAGGTVDTERSFLTGYTKLHNFRKDTNSYVQYFREQGYTTEGNHPIYGWFYNRQNVNEYLGFDNYYFYENRYQKICEENNLGYARDWVFLPDIIQSYEKNKKTGKPYFNFSVTYQNHGPYSDVRDYMEPFLQWKDGYNESDYNIWNNYFAGIGYTNDQLKNMVDYFREETEPVVLIFFGDHNPWGGDNNSAYEMLGINFDFSTDEGFYNYYCTPYIIWANDTAKEVLGNDFTGDGGSIGPYFLMNRFFDLAGFKGNEYMEITNELIQNGIDVVHQTYFRENGVLTDSLSSDGQIALDKFLKLQYYYMTNFITQDME